MANEIPRYPSSVLIQRPTEDVWYFTLHALIWDLPIFSLKIMWMSDFYVGGWIAEYLA